eukprot:TRINITY_DN13943_c0_g1_i1.p1 TRINITY_DN13943_c0_g1~~TRINITY_DN13943_c0_g1_i1.p1  ORF type:complete len:112 (-),score=6.22 TRINITY_DN13943_c0_g1_i1:7-342(-)
MNSYMTGKSTHELIPENSAEVPGVPKTETTIAYNFASQEAKKHQEPVQVGSLGNKMHHDVSYNLRTSAPTPFQNLEQFNYPDGKRPGTPIPPPKGLKNSDVRHQILNKSQQ